ncbi:RDD family protein [Virgibacillus sp. JSM 102003]|uniref:RDD family protein n=1 Tax=Virgibacillus sp. JSM 102003 TaxID=1562108 RepID=UPI0035C17EBB
MSYATFLLRFKAFIIDYILILVYIVLITLLNGFIIPSLQGLFTGSLVVAQLTSFLMVTLPVSIYFIISDSVIGRQSVGKKKTGIQVVDKNGEPLSIIHITFRTVLKFLPWQLRKYKYFLTA